MHHPDEPDHATDTGSVPANSLDAGLAAAFARPASEEAGDGLPAVPGYRVLREIARGGMGRILAARDLTLDREVAIKVLLPGANADRFVRESKIAARLPHPGIPPVHALGTLAGGSPFLAMKLIAGQTLADELKTADRPRLLQAFAQVCQAVGFAHSRGVIHRDLKPANVMVGAFGEVQVMDWGLAKDLTGRPLADEAGPPEVPAAPRGSTDAVRTVRLAAAGESTGDQTRAGTVLGTPAYMAPEQARGEATDARSDVFALGGMLCAILTGQPPFRGDSATEVIQQAGAADLADVNARLDSCGAGVELLALCRRCLNPDPAARPADGQAVADGLTAYLNGVQERFRAAELDRASEAARAAEATRTAAEANERARAERRARRVQLVALVVLAGGIVGTTFEWGQADRARVRAEAAEGEAGKRADQLQQVADYQAKMLKQIDPAEAGVKLMADLLARLGTALEKDKVPEAERATRVAAFGRELHAVNATDTAVAMLDRTVLAPAVRAIGAQFADQPKVDATLRMTLGGVYEKLGRYEESLALCRRAYALRVESLGEEHRETLESLAAVGGALSALRRMDEAERDIRRALETCRRVLGADDPQTLGVQNLQAMLLYNQGKLEECEATSRDVLERRTRVLGPEHSATLTTMNDLGMFLKIQDKRDESVAVLKKAVEGMRRQPNLAPNELFSLLDNLGVALLAQEKFAEAEPYLREALAGRRQYGGEDHPRTLVSLNNLAALLEAMGRLDEAEPLAREALEKSRRIRGNEHRETLVTLNVLALIYQNQGKLEKAGPLYREALATGRRVLGEDHPDTITWASNLATLLVSQGKYSEAEPLSREVAAKMRRKFGNDHMNSIITLANLGALLEDSGKLAEAETTLREAVEKGRRAAGEGSSLTFPATIRLGQLLATRGNAAEALALLAPIEGKVRETYADTEAHRVARLLLGLGKARVTLAKTPVDFDAATANLVEARELYVKTRGPDHRDTRASTQALADAYAARDKAEPGKGYDAKAAEWKAKLGKQ
jgi:tetratricopeptide (TPR) repeat protein